MMNEGDICSKCEKGKLLKPKVFYRVFEKGRQPDFICDHCGASSWKLPEVESPLPIKEKEAQETKEPEKFDWKKEILKRPNFSQEKGKNSTLTIFKSTRKEGKWS